VLLISLLLSAVVRYGSEAALIRMVSETEESGERLSVRQGLRRGFSRSAWRLFLIDLAIQVPLALMLTLLLALALSPMLLWLTGSEAAGVAGTVFGTGLLVLFVLTVLLAWIALSALLPPCAPACAVDGLGVRASIRRAAGLFKASLGGVASIWFTWFGVELAWKVALIVVVVLLSPVLLLALVAGVLAGGLLALPVGAYSASFWEGSCTWIVGAIVGLPILFLALSTPVAFVRGLVEVFLSGLWTLAYRAACVRQPPRKLARRRSQDEKQARPSRKRGWSPGSSGGSERAARE